VLQFVTLYHRSFPIFLVSCIQMSMSMCTYAKLRTNTFTCVNTYTPFLSPSLSYSPTHPHTPTRTHTRTGGNYCGNRAQGVCGTDGTVVCTDDLDCLTTGGELLFAYHVSCNTLQHADTSQHTDTQTSRMFCLLPVSICVYTHTYI